ncbi:glycosyltransferase [Winogradskyella maritima]|uniref:Glycosyltransferase n=1 Tax=Winogradskyella maritima TaxID=1517766 RepID=A0ABV8AG73_9FLAO|nr:glycosyltransferase [Winogradskyella maritima]
MTLLSLLFYSFVAVVALQVIYYSFYLIYFPSEKTSERKQHSIPVSVIVCAKNESENLKKLIPLLLEQDHPNFELVLINDDSFDDTLEIIEQFEARHANIKCVNVKSIDKFWGNKKYALTLGIKASKNDFLLFTDADCQPRSHRWISEMSSHFSNQKAIVLGYGAYRKKKGLLNALIRFETVLTAIQYFSYAKAGLTYMGVGRNLAYRKELFFKHSGFMNHMELRSGDDDLFINEASDSKNTAICLSPEGFTESQPKTNFKSWFYQKRRHVSTAKHYKGKHKCLLGLFYLSQVLFWVLGIALVCTLYLWPVVLGLIGFRFILQITTWALASKRLKEKLLWVFAPILEPFLIAIQFCIFIANLISKPLYWK